MTPEILSDASRHRLAMFVLGGGAALALWALVENGEALGLPPVLYLGLFSFVAIHAGVALALAGPLPVRRALTGASLISVPLAALVSLASLRHVVATDLLDAPVLLSVIWVMVHVATPFLLVRLVTPGQWRDYGALFDAAWAMAMRYGLALVFVGVFWLVVFLSNALFQLVGVGIIQWLLDTDWTPFALSGAMLGLGLAVVYELRATISPFLILRLLRLLVPLVLVVLLVFLGAMPFRGLSGLFGEFSSGATLMGTAIVTITLVSSALDRDAARAVNTRAMRVATRALALLLPLLAALAVWAVVLRVRQYGWTPDRLLAATVAGFVLAYGLGYGLAALRGGDWPGRVRQVNVWAAMAVVVVGALWLTPVLDPYRISANAQVARYKSGVATLDQLPLWMMQHEWGRPGRDRLAGLERLTGRADQAELQSRIRAVRDETSKYRYRQTIDQSDARDDAQVLADLLPVRTTVQNNATPLSREFLQQMPPGVLDRWLKGCEQTVPDGRPGCVFVSGNFLPRDGAGQQGIVLYLNDRGKARADHVLVLGEADTLVQNVFDPTTGRRGTMPQDVITRTLDGQFDIQPSGIQALQVGDWVLVPDN